ncbi:RNI-like protein [Backusella circina FSU 941]|nr:RNI-like protein [Backusella circina FSU 941]
MSDTHFASRFGFCVKSLVLKPSPRLIPAQLTSALNQSVIENDDQLQPTLRGYARLERVDYNLTGLERLNRPWYPDTKQENENHGEIDTSQKESEWLSFVKDEETVTVLSHCSQLEYLDLSGCDHLTDNTLFALATGKQNGCPLVGLWLSLMREVTAEGINALLQVEKNKTSKLKYLDLSFLLHLRDQTIQDIAEQWGPSLIHLRVNSIYELSDTAAPAIAKCKQLELLYLTRCWKLSNSSMRIIARGCSRLRYVSAAYLSYTNEEGIKHFIHSCPRLVWLDISGCSINSLFKPTILASWDSFRRNGNYGLVTIKDYAMHTL